MKFGTLTMFQGKQIMMSLFLMTLAKQCQKIFKTRVFFEY